MPAAQKVLVVRGIRVALLEARSLIFFGIFQPKENGAREKDGPFGSPSRMSIDLSSVVLYLVENVYLVFITDEQLSKSLSIQKSPVLS